MAATQTARPVERPRVSAVGTVLACFGILAYFAGLIGIYLSQRVAFGRDEWMADINLPLTTPNMMIVTIGLSCLPMQWALWAIARNDRANAYVAFGLTAMFGVAVINSQYWLYQQMALEVAETTQAVLIYAISGSFIGLLISALVYLGIVTFRTLGGQYGPHQHDTVTGVTIYWYTMVAVFAVIWLAVYVTK